MASIIAVCKSNHKGTRKEVVSKGFLDENYGLAGDAHADCTSHRQVSLLAIESIDRTRDSGFTLNPGDFAENLTTEGLDLTSLPIGTQLYIGDAILEVTQIGKQCHTGCAVFREIGKCIMPKEGIFTKVIHQGYVQAGDTIEIIGTKG